MVVVDKSVNAAGSCYAERVCDEERECDEERVYDEERREAYAGWIRGAIVYAATG